MQIKLKDEPFHNVSDKFLGTILARKNDELSLEFDFDFTGLNEAELRGYNDYIMELRGRAWSEYIKNTNMDYTVENHFILTYEFYTEQEVRKRNLKGKTTVIGCIVLLLVFFATFFIK